MVINNIALEETTSYNIFMEDGSMPEVELFVGIEEAYGELLVEQMRDEFHEFKTEGTIMSVNEGYVDKAKTFLAKIWNKIKMYFKKFMNAMNRVTGNVYRFFQAKKQAIAAGCEFVQNFQGYPGLKTFDRLKGIISVTTAVSVAVKSTQAAIDSNMVEGIVRKAAAKISGSEDVKQFDANVTKSIRGADSPQTIKYSFNELQAVLGKESYSAAVSGSMKTIEASIKDAERRMQQKQADPNASTDFELIKRLITLQVRAVTICSRSIRDIISQANSYAHKAASVAIGAAHHEAFSYEDADEIFDY